ncbi:serine hydrolase domain-containing protein [Chryseobacterium gambrini]|uniref:Serine hydrolase domain-containing protein n=1 Tax=Chryseobacterium gambrini TaxID=373672 RepID=A0AAJ1R4C2_9FLAO|nr:MULTISPECIES: serine hydrolase domain-containing protein [Chryseobacterium]MDN4012835.1 serine hydrolase domain-containing protein [Chryseobacterium gambrini]MDN4030656.1 serine hydrolase domain-containing protein [Chryseobacterium gambrini]QWA36625.1 beta-lactamase family protein [Chryseobacterium sp. ZHDP1]
MIKNFLFSTLSAFLFIGLISCEKEIKFIPSAKITDRQAIADSTMIAFEKSLLKNQIDSVFKKYQFNGSVAVFKDSVELYRKNQGFADFKDQLKINDSTVFAIGSVSKQFTAALILLQMEQGKLNVDDKVSTYLKEFQNKNYENITIHQLLNHTSGLNTLGGKLQFKSGTDFFYSNDGFNTLGKIVEKVSGKSYDENILDLFKEAGMNHSSTATSFEGENFAGAFLGNQKNFEKIQNMPKRLAGKDIGVPAGGILSTINDLHAWNNALYSGKILRPETLKKFESKSAERHHAIFGKMGYGYGIMSNIGKPLAFFHSGYVKGSPSLNIFYPETKTSVIILSNISDEEQGKGFTFKPHVEIKKITDALESTISEMNSSKGNAMKM